MGGSGRGLGGGRRGGSGGWNRNQGGERKGKIVNIDTSDPVQNMFGQISKVLDARHDKRERIVKLSRDITIESKRIIFCLHRIKSEEDRKSVLDEASARLEGVKDNLWFTLARELESEDHYQYIKAYSPGLQEWVEALSFYHYLQWEKLITYEQVEQELVFKEKGKKQFCDFEENINDGGENDITKDDIGDDDKKETEDVSVTDTDSKDQEGCEEKLISVPSEYSLCVTVPQSEYILGLADLTGELMRNAINSLGSGNMDVCFVLLDILQNMSEGFSKLPRHEAPRDIGQKVYTLKQSCKKVENACYAISVRGSEIPKNHLADIFTQKREEGFIEEGPGGGEVDYYDD